MSLQQSQTSAWRSRSSCFSLSCSSYDASSGARYCSLTSLEAREVTWRVQKTEFALVPEGTAPHHGGGGPTPLSPTSRCASSLCAISGVRVGLSVGAREGVRKTARKPNVVRQEPPPPPVPTCLRSSGEDTWPGTAPARGSGGALERVRSTPAGVSSTLWMGRVVGRDARSDNRMLEELDNSCRAIPAPQPTAFAPPSAYPHAASEQPLLAARSRPPCSARKAV